jgi:hypothetical protein
LITNKNTQYLLISDGNFVTDSSYSFSKNHNHRANMRIEYTIDSMNSIIMVPRLSLQNNSNNSDAISLITGGAITSLTTTDNFSDNSGYNFGNDLTWRHKFLRKGRTLSVRSSISYDNRDNNTTNLARIDEVPDNQLIGSQTDYFNLNTNLNYTEPIGKNSQLQLNYNNRFSRGDINKEIFGLSGDVVLLGRMDSLSNIYNNDDISNRAGLSYLYRTEKLNLSVGVNYDRTDLRGNQQFPQKARVSETYQNWLPNFMINYKFSEITNLRVFYRTDTEEPEITELQNAIDNSDRRRLSTGNPGLKQQYSHNLMSNFSYANPTSGFNAFVFLRAGYATDIISRKTIWAQNDTLYRPQGIDVILYPGSRLTYPVNLDHQYSFNSMVNLSYFVKPIKSNVSLVTGLNYFQNPEYAGEALNRLNTYGMLNSLIITSNISQNVDFTLSYTSNYSNTKYSLASVDDEFQWYQSANAKLNLILWKGITFNTDLVGQYNQGSGLPKEFSKKYFVWNASVGKKFLKNQAAELRVGAYDILDQNRSIYRTVDPTQIVDTRVNAYRRYFLVLFTYNLRASKGQNSTQQQQGERREGFPGGGPPPGMPPGGFRPGGGPPGGYHDH